MIANGTYDSITNTLTFYTFDNLTDPMFSVFNSPINAGKESFQRSYEMTYKFKNFNYDCAENDGI